MDFLCSFRFRPSEQVKLGLESGQIHLSVEGLWAETILYEIPLLSLISEAYFKFCDRDWDHDGQEERAYRKGVELLEHGCIFSEFGTRRRRDYHTQDLVLRGLTRAATSSSKGSLSGTSNVHFAMKYNISPVGTVAHEWFMGIAALTGDYKSASERALRSWVECFRPGVLAIALTDTFGTPAFLQAFKQPIPRALMRNPKASNCSYAQAFTGIRQDSGDPQEFIKLMHNFYHEQGITDKKIMVFSDSLNVARCLEYKAAAEALGFQPTFGIGTFLTSRSCHLLIVYNGLFKQMTSPTVTVQSRYPLTSLSSSLLQMDIQP